MTGEVDLLEAELIGLRSAYDLECARLQAIADYVGATDYCDSIGPILDAIDRLKAGAK